MLTTSSRGVRLSFDDGWTTPVMHKREPTTVVVSHRQVSTTVDFMLTTSSRGVRKGRGEGGREQGRE